MKQIILIAVLFLLIGCGKQDNNPREEIYFYFLGDEKYDKYGYYSEIIRHYDYPYNNVKMTSWNPENNTTHCIHFFINEYNDTVRIIFVDNSNYPRREE